MKSLADDPHRVNIEDVRPLAADGVVLDERGVLLLCRDHPPFEGEWVLPGGLVEPDERASDACVREVREEVGLEVRALEFVGLYDDPDRDERGNVSAAYRCSAVDDREPAPREEARTVEWFDPDALPEMGFDHEQIVTDAVGVLSGR